MRKISFFVLMTTLFIMNSCGDKYRFKLNSPRKISINKKLILSVSEKNSKPFDSVVYFLDGIKIKLPKSYNITNQKLGKHAVKAIVYYNENHKKLTNTIYFLAKKKPILYSYKIVNTYPHDASAFTQGLEYHNGYLYESTGQLGESSLRKVDLKTGRILKKIDIDKQYFGEGMTVFNGKIIMLTWQENIGFVYNLNDFSFVKNFNYSQSREGWGLTHNTEFLIKSDGTERIWFLNPETLKETHFIEAYTNTRKVEKLNELEYIKGKIYANVWQKNTILIINPVNGTIEGIIDLKGLDNKAIKGSDDDAVLNGIAYDAKTDRLFVTGKDWDKLFEIKIFKN
ncbi:MAG: glutaminyl-peptide cyclotransferase [Flavobacteriaceae bacterium]|nr:glutaminyl-peptide cyclotransferase [Flavobacteriaceae bacterium]